MLWAITSYFNPLHYRRRRQNFREFRRRLRIPLVAVELGYDARFDLGPADAEILVRLDGHDVLWQKERLLNIALGRLPPPCTAVASIDCDVFFARDDWAGEALAALDRHAVVQPFSRVHHLGPAWMPGADPDRASLHSQPSAAASVQFCPPAATLGAVAQREGDSASPGFAWVYRRDILERHGFFDGCIVGGGDTAMACAAFGCPEAVVRLHGMNPSQERYYRRWAGPFFESVRRRVHFVGGEIFHLWHGRLTDRRPARRHFDLQQFDFDPFCDIAGDAGQVWRWNSTKPGLHAYLKDYFASRREDG